MALTHTPATKMGLPCPDFKLLGMDGKWHSRDDFRDKPLIVMFICNHCPYVQAIENRLIELSKEALKLGADTVGICSNDAEDYPEDSYDNLKSRWHQKNYGFPYLHDPSQEAAKAFDAVCTPDFFVYDAKHNLRYRGRLDDSWKDPAKVEKQELLEALEQIVKGQSLDFEQTPSMGCSIKWIKN